MQPRSPAQPPAPASDDRQGPDPTTTHLAPGDQAAPGTPGTGETVCPDCGGSGQRNGRDCPTCEGSGKLTVGIGGA